MVRVLHLQALKVENDHVPFSWIPKVLKSPFEFGSTSNCYVSLPTMVVDVFVVVVVVVVVGVVVVAVVVVVVV